MSNTTDEQIEFEVALIRESGVTEPLVIVPGIKKRCFLPCRLGYCNCTYTIDKSYCVVVESIKKSCMDECNKEIQYLNEKIGKYNDQHS
jgi:hypothetical protein